MGISVDGFDSLSAKILAAQARAVPLVAAVVRKTAADVQATAQVNAPVDTGMLRASYNTEHGGGGMHVWAEVKPAANYAIYVELGTSRMAPQPHLFPALDHHAPAFKQAVGAIARSVFHG